MEQEKRTEFEYPTADPLYKARDRFFFWKIVLAIAAGVILLFTLFQKRLLGSLYGEANPRADIPRLLSLYREGKLLLDETVTHEYKLAEVNEGYEDMRAGKNIRGVVIHDH